LRAFEAAARRGNFARAADELSVTAAAVSHRIKELEAVLDAQLFVRQARGVRLTEAGERYHRGIARAFDEIERATVQVGEASIDGPLKVSMPQSFAQVWFASRAARLVHRWPGLVLNVDGDSRLADLRRGTVDVGLRFGPGVYAGLHSEPLMADAVTVLAAPSFMQRHEGLSLAELLAQAPLLEDTGVAAGEAWSTWGPWLRETGLGTKPGFRRLRFSDSAMMLAACQASAGLCVGRVSVAFAALQRRELQPLLPWRSSEFAYHLVTRPADSDNPRILAFQAWLLEETRDFTDAVAQALGVTLSRSASPR
jgi:LysR family transcriptional regulator, glycine cleavage system transcriptional activator